MHSYSDHGTASWITGPVGGANLFTCKHSRGKLSPGIESVLFLARHPSWSLWQAHTFQEWRVPHEEIQWGCMASIWRQRHVTTFCRLNKLPVPWLYLQSTSIYSVKFWGFFFWFSIKMCKLSTKWDSGPWPNILLLYQLPCLFPLLLLPAPEAESLNTTPFLLGLSGLPPKQHILHRTPERGDPGGQHAQASNNKWI